MKKMYTIIGVIVLVVAGYWFYSKQLSMFLPHVKITGIAVNLKNGAQVDRGKDGLVLIENLSAWPEATVGKTVTVWGKSINKQVTVPKAVVDENGAVSQGAETDIAQQVLHDLIKWKIESN
jgi:hypothetical protein